MWLNVATTDGDFQAGKTAQADIWRDQPWMEFYAILNDGLNLS